jgi:hypothetical protein
VAGEALGVIGRWLLSPLRLSISTVLVQHFCQCWCDEIEIAVSAFLAVVSRATLKSPTARGRQVEKNIRRWLVSAPAIFQRERELVSLQWGS